MKLAIAIAVLACACSASQKQVEADSAYVAEHIHCVEKYDTRKEIDACRQSVRIRWGIAETVKDAGGDQ